MYAKRNVMTIAWGVVILQSHMNTTYTNHHMQYTIQHIWQMCCLASKAI